MPWDANTVIDRRMEFVHLAKTAAVTMTELCGRFGISRKTGYKWLERAEETPPEEAGHAQPPLAERLQDRSRRPSRSPLRCAEPLEQAVLRLRRANPAWGGRKISHVLARDLNLQIASSTVTHVLHRNNLIGRTASDAATRWQRFEHDCPNSLWQMDFKGHFPTGEGRCHPLTVLDDHSRFNIVLFASANEQRSSVQQSLHEAFERYGLPDRINTDNGPPWGHRGTGELTALAVWLMRLGIKLSYSAPYHPQTNGKDERFHRSLKAEVLQQTFRDLAHVQRALDAWRLLYNFERPHQGLDMATPSTRYRPSPRTMPDVLPVFVYAIDDAVRKVQQGGYACFMGRELRVSKALIGNAIAFRPNVAEDGVYDIYFCRQRIGQVDLRLMPKTGSK